MSTSVRNKLFFTFILLCFGKCFGEEYCGHIGISSAAPGNIEIIYVNGIDNTSYDACSSSQLVINTLRQTDRYNYDYVYNPTEGSVDKKELSWQAKLSQSALSPFGYDSAAVFADPAKKRNYYSLLGGLYADAIARGEVGAGSMFKTTLRLKNYIAGELARTAKPKLVIVAHSQGNFYIEAAYAMLIREALLKGDVDVSDLENRVRVVGVASVATSTPNNRYLSHSMDAAVFTGQEALSVFSRWNYSPLKPNIDACTTSPCSNFASDGSLAALFRVAKLPDDSTNVALHNFRAVYMNPKIYDRSTGDSFPTIITRMINESVTELLSSDQKLNNYANGHSYELITCGTWSQCRDAAKAKGGSLVTIRNQAENDWLATNMLQQAKPDFAVWIGFTDAGHEGNWTWASGEVKPYSNWYPGEPSNSGNVENYAIIYNSGEYKDKWNDVQNDYPYVTKAVVEYPSSVPSSSTWNAVADYSLALNPNGAWSYGYQSQTSSIAPMLVTNVNCADIGMDCWKISALAPDIPMVAINRSGATIVKRTVVVPTGVLVLHPGMNGERAVVSWAAPTDGNYKIVGQFDIVDVIPSGVQVVVTEDATQLISANLSRRSMSQQINLTRTLTKGQIISFSVDSAGNYGNDSTSLSVTITKSVGGGAITVLANTIPGAAVTVPSGASSCSFVSTGTWSAGPQAPPQYQNADGVIGGTSYNLTNSGVPIPSAPNMALVVKHSSSGNWDLLGSNKTISVVAGETLSFMMNDATTFGYTDGNTGQLSTVWSCN